MYVRHRESGKILPVTIMRLNKSQVAAINKTKRFPFNWNKEKDCEIYQLNVKGLAEPLGLLAVKDRPEDIALEIRLLASSSENIGKEKTYERIAGNLIAFACRLAFQRGYGGYVCLKPKTELTSHYQELYGFQSTKLFLITEGSNSLDLINRYDNASEK